MRDISFLENNVPINREDIEDILAMTPVQEGLLFHYLEDPGGGYYSGQLTLDLLGEIDKPCFERAWGQVILQNEMLRTVFRWEKVKQPVQLILKNPPVCIRYHDVSGEPGDEKKRLLEEIQARERQEGFDLHQVPFRVILCKTGSDNYRMMVCSHHILYDGWSSGLILEEFFNAYGNLSQGREMEMPLKTKLKSYLKWLREQEAEATEWNRAEYWKEYLKGLDTRGELSIKSDTPGKDGSYTVKLPQDEINPIGSFLKHYKVTLAALFYTAWGILLQEYTGGSDVVIGTTVSGRSIPLPGIEHTVGLFINTPPLRIWTAAGKCIDGGSESRLDLLLRTAAALQKRRAFENTPLVKIKEYAGRRGWGAAGSLFDTIVVVENYPLVLDPFLVQESSGLLITSYSVNERNHYDLTLTVKVIEGIELEFIYSRYFDEKDITRLAGHFRKVVREIVNHPGAPVETIDMLSEEEKRQALFAFNDTDAEYPEGKTIHGLFEEQVEKTPDRIALHGCMTEWMDGDVGANRHLRVCPSPNARNSRNAQNIRNVSLTYRQLNEQSNRLAGILIDKGVVADDIVAIMMQRSIEMMIGIYGILKAGAAYLPIDPEYPIERINYMLRDSAARILINKSEIRNPLKGCPRRGFSNFDIGASDFNSSNLAYLIYTSGSTGRPKGVMVGHRSLVNRVIWMQKSYPLDSGDVVLQKTPITFDVSVWELFWWGIAGAALCLLEVGGEKDPAVIGATVGRHGVTVIHFVPSMLNMMLEYIGKEGIAKGLRTLRRVFSSGEVLSPAMAARFNRVLHECNHTQLTNLYGPTEATVDVSWYDCSGPGHVHGNIIPIGKPIDNIKLYILDRYWRLVPVGLAGELCIAGVGVARGYLNQPEQTAEKFRPQITQITQITMIDEIKKINKSVGEGKGPAVPHLVFYKTGDLAGWLPDGNIRFLGRIDGQVKIRGFRIELGEIEARLLRHEAVREAVVLIKEEAGNDKYLCAYIVSEKGYPVNTTQLKEYLSQSLPGYMIPSRFIYLETMPVTANGKVDRKALPGPTADRDASTAVYMGPEREIEKEIAGLWKEVLNLGTVGVNDNFFDLGGHSLHIIRLTGRIKEIFGKDIPVTTMFRYPTIRALARHLEGKRGEASPPGQQEQWQGRGHGRQPGATEIAVIGMAVRVPGAVGCEEFWNNLKNGVESITFFTDEQLREAGVPGHLIANPDYVKAKGILENSHHFDAPFFGYSPREARLMDPQLRLLHECTWGALEQAGYDSATYKDGIGLYVGALANASWLERVSGHIRDHSDWLAVGSITDRDFFGTRIAYKLDLRGPAVTVQTACSTSLAAIQMACRALLAGECQVAMAGGVSISHEDENGYLYREGMVRSPDGHCRAFDAQANGTVGGNGAGIVVLKPLAAALAEGDFIHAVVKGAALNNDGARKIGYTAPSIEGQAAVIRAALRAAAVEPETITYIETHGTGTKLGDPVEIEALTLAFNTPKKQFCAVGSVKTNIGHLDAAAGVVGFIKTVLALEHRLLPPSLHFRRPNPAIDFDNGPFYVNTRLGPWKTDGFPLRAGVSSFGIGGANVHVILEEFTGATVPRTNRDPGRKHLLVLSAGTGEALDRVTLNLADYLKNNRHLDAGDVAYTLQVGRRALEHRRFAVVSGIDDAVDVLSTPGSTGIPRLHSFSTTESDRPVVFMFPGQGAQYIDMGLGLYQREPLFREEMDRCFEILKPLMGTDLKGVLYPSLDSNGATGSGSRADMIDQTEMAQPAIFVIEYALARLIMSWGIQPRAMIGHSIGEYTAACIAGVLSPGDALRLVVQRGEMMRRMPPGAMLAVFLPEERVISFLNEHISLAAVNGPASCVVAGAVEHIRELAVTLGEAGIENRLLHTSHAFHSAMMDPVLETFHAVVRGVGLNPPRIPYICNIDGSWTTPQRAVDPGYWVAHLRNTVRFNDGLAEILREERALLMEIGPGRTLSTFVLRHPHKKSTQEVVNLLRHPGEQVPDHDFLLGRVGRIWGSGVTIDWSRFDSPGARRRIPLPAYPFTGLPFLPEKIISAPGAKRKELADWFYIPVWRQSLPGESYPIEPYPIEPYPIESHPIESHRMDRDLKKFTWLVFMDDRGFGLRLADWLEKRGQGVVRVEKGVAFGRKSSGVYTMDPRSGADYEKMVEIVAGIDHGKPTRILHLWGVTPSRRDIIGKELFQTVEADLDSGFYSLLYLARAVGKTGPTAPLYIDVITNDMQPVVGDEPLRPGKAAVLGPVKIIPLEYPNIRCRAIDIRLPECHGTEEERLIENVMAEIFPGDGSAVVVAFRGCYRWEQVMEPLRFGECKGPHPRLREKGVYLITGGLGGIGYTLAEHLASQLKARLILVGRSQLTAGGAWRQKVKKLEGLGAEVLAYSCDISNVEGMKKVTRQAARRFGVIDGVLHAAGVADYAGIIQRRTRALDEPILAPKVQGTLVLDTLLEKMSPGFMILFSTIGSVAWGQKFGQVAYAAANEFLDVYSFYRAARTGRPCVSVNWSDWREVGMAVPAAAHWAGALHMKEDSDSLLKDAMLPSEGVEVFRRILEHPFPRVVVSPEELSAKIENSNTAFREWVERKEKSTPAAPPAAEIEQTITAVWREFLGSEAVGPHDNFFDLGASSLDIIRVNNRLKGALRIEIPLVTMYTYPTVHSLATHLCPVPVPGSPALRNEGRAGRGEKLKKQVQGIERSRLKLDQTIRKLKGTGYDKKK